MGIKLKKRARQAEYKIIYSLKYIKHIIKIKDNKDNNKSKIYITLLNYNLARIHSE